MKCVKPRERCVILRERTRVNDPKSASGFGEPPVAIDVVCGRRGPLDLVIAEKSGANAVLGLARCFGEVFRPLFPAGGRGQPFSTANGARDYATRSVVC